MLAKGTDVVSKRPHENVALSRALETFLQRTCDGCRQRLFDLGPCKHCGDQNVHLTISYEAIPKRWRECEVRVSMVETDADGRRTHKHRKSGRKDLELVFRKKWGGDRRVAFEVLLFDRMSHRKRHTVHVLDGETFVIEHDEAEAL
jgi:hypothetical protein